MEPRYISDRVKLILALKVLLMFVISTVSTRQCTSKKTERDSFVIKNIGIKLCHLKCAEHGQCASIEYDIETLTCRLLRYESKAEKKEGHVILARSHSHHPTDSCSSVTCTFGQRCLKTRSRPEVCVQASTDSKPYTVPPAPVTTQDSYQQISTTDASEGLTPSETDPPAPVTTQNCDPHATPSTAIDRKLFSASEVGDLQRVKLILASVHVDINSRGQKSRTAVMWAAMGGHSDVVKFLVDRGADVSLVDKVCNNILHLACRSGDLETVNLILSLDVLDINSRGQKSRTAVMWAAWRGHSDVVKFLVGRGADVSLVDRVFNNILHWACLGGDLETVNLILSLDVLDINSRGHNCGTPLMLAAGNRRWDVVEFLVGRGADVSPVDMFGNNILHWACLGGDLETVNLILSRDVLNINSRGHNSRTPVMLAAENRNWDVVEFLVGRGADVSPVDMFGNNILHLACLGGDLDTVKLILSLDVLDINSRGGISRTPVMLAAVHRNWDVVEFLVDRGADVSPVDMLGNNILHLACQGGDVDTVKLILSLDVLDINRHNGDGQTAAVYARRNGHQLVLDLMVSHGAQ